MKRWIIPKPGNEECKELSDFYVITKVTPKALHVIEVSEKMAFAAYNKKEKNWLVYLGNNAFGWYGEDGLYNDYFPNPGEAIMWAIQNGWEVVQGTESELQKSA